MNRRQTYYSKGLKKYEIAGWVITKADASISVITRFRKKEAFLVRIVSTGQSFLIKEKFISSSLIKSMKTNRVVSLPKGSRVSIELALSLGIPYEESRSSTDLALWTKAKKGGMHRTLRTKKFAIKKYKFSGQGTIDRISSPNDPDETDDPGPMIKGKP